METPFSWGDMIAWSGIVLGLVALLLTFAGLVGAWIAKKHNRKVMAFFRASQVGEKERELNAILALRDHTQKCLRMHYEEMGNAIKSGDKESIVKAYRNVSDKLSGTIDGVAPIEERLRAQLSERRDKYEEAKVKAECFF